MRRVACACAVWFAVASAGAAAGAATPPRASLTGGVCRASPNPLDRAVGITAVMRPLTGTARMELMFQLQQRPLQGGSYTLVHARGLGRWLHPSTRNLGQRPNDVWRLDKPVVNLSGPDFYRFRVTFRWRSRAGGVLGRTVRLGPSCYQPR